MKKTFFSNLILRLFLNLLVKPFFVFAIDLTIQNRVGASDYGFYFSLFSLSMMLNILLDLGITNFNNRNIAQYNQLLNKHLSNISVLRILLGVFYTIVILAVGFISGYNQEQFKMLYFLIINQFLLQFILYLRSNISGLQLFKIDTVISVLDRLILILICGVLLWANFFKGPFKIEWFVYAQTISYLITFIFALIISISKAGKLKFSFNTSFYLVILKQSFPYALLIFLMSFYNRFDGYIIERIAIEGKQEAGIYAQGFRILEALSQFSLLFAGLLLPMFAKMIKDKEPLNELINLSYSLIGIPAVIIIVPSIFYSLDIMSVLYVHEQQKASEVFAILIVCFLPISTTYIFGTLLTANGSLKPLNITAMVGVIANISINLILIPVLGAKGAAISSFTTQTITAVVQFFIAKRTFRFEVNLLKFAIIVAFIACYTYICYLSKTINIDWKQKYLLLITVGGIMVFAFRIFKVSYFKSILKSNQ